ncbi:MAG: hypothetical protein OIF35_09430 [Cellvibrionaceae bacterium]|nr:hypothetical protein [Cellvibrionaceae bacterium]MCV6625353.1 hypothetical protein [Cellvibrionaceae bacterium]
MKVRFSPLKQAKPSEDNGVPLKYAPAKRTAYQARWYLILALALSPVILFTLWLYFSWVQVHSDGVVSMTPQKLSSPGEGIVEKIYVKTGQVLAAGAPLIKIRTPVLDAEIAELERQLSELEGANMEPLELQIDRVLADQERSSDNNQNQLQALEQDYEALHNKQIIDRGQLAQMQQLRFQSELWYSNAQAERLREQQQQQQRQIGGANAQQIRALKHQLVKLKARRQLFLIHTPDGAQVNDISVAEGNLVNRGEELIYLSERSEAKVLAYLAPKFIDYTRQGSEVEVQFPNGYKATAYISEPVTLIRTLPSRLADPFETNRPVLKVTLSFREPLPGRLKVEGLPVKVKHGTLLLDNPGTVDKLRFWQ